MNGLLKSVKRELKALYRDEQGADMIEYILIVAAIALPLIAVIIWFWKDISSWTKQKYDQLRGRSDSVSDNPSVW